ncbi:hypothetical protein AB8I92_003975 [Vibrio alginolyticus]
MSQHRSSWLEDGQNLVSYITKLERNGLAHVWRGNAPLKIKTASENNSN